MILGVGVDVVQIERFQKYQIDSPFVVKHFTHDELAYANAQGAGYVQTLAGMYGAKEALVKALGLGFRSLTSQDITITHDPLGKPGFFFSAKATNVLQEKGVAQAFLSISHDAGIATAFVVVEGGVLPSEPSSQPFQPAPSASQPVVAPKEHI